MQEILINTKDEQSRSNSHRCSCNLSPKFSIVLPGIIYCIFKSTDTGLCPVTREGKQCPRPDAHGRVC